MMNLKALSNLQLHEQTKYQASVVRMETTKLLHHLVEVERRRVYAEFGTGSLFDYCVRHLEMSHPCASRHVNSARMMREIPEIEEKIQSGELTLTTVSQAQVFFKREAKLAEVLRRTGDLLGVVDVHGAGGGCGGGSGAGSGSPSSVDVHDSNRSNTSLGEAESCAHGPKKYSTAEKREVLNRLTNKSTREAEKVLLSLASEPQAASIECVRAINETATEIKFVADKETMANLERMKEIWSHKMPGATFGDVIKEMAHILVQQNDPLKKAQRAEVRKQKRSKLKTSVVQNAGARSSDALQSRELPAGPRLPKVASSEAQTSEVHSPEARAPGVQTSEARLAEVRSSDARSSDARVSDACTSEGCASEPQDDSRLEGPSEEEIKEAVNPTREGGSRNPGVSVLDSATALTPTPAPDEAMRHYRSRYISSAVRHAVYMRDGGKCTHIDPQTGARCDSRYRIDLDHIIPFAKCGKSTVENLRLRCRQHNLWYAIRVFGWRRCKVAY